MDGYCNACGTIFDIRQAACPQCGRCPQCGSRLRANLRSCPDCSHPLDEEKLGELARRLDPARPSNQGTIRLLQVGREHEGIFKRVSGGRFVLFVIMSEIVILVPLFTLFHLLAVTDWAREITLAIVHIAAVPLVAAAIRRGKLQWLVQKIAKP